MGSIFRQKQARGFEQARGFCLKQDVLDAFSALRCNAFGQGRVVPPLLWVTKSPKKSGVLGLILLISTFHAFTWRCLSIVSVCRICMYNCVATMCALCEGLGGGGPPSHQYPLALKAQWEKLAFSLLRHQKRQQKLRPNQLGHEP